MSLLGRLSLWHGLRCSPVGPSVPTDHKDDPSLTPPAWEQSPTTLAATLSPSRREQSSTLSNNLAEPIPGTILTLKVSECVPREAHHIYLRDAAPHPLHLQSPAFPAQTEWNPRHPHQHDPKYPSPSFPSNEHVSYDSPPSSLLELSLHHWKSIMSQLPSEHREKTPIASDNNNILTHPQTYFNLQREKHSRPPSY